MKQQKMKTSEQITRKQNFTLLELLDRLLDKGVVVKGEILLAVADIDLVYLNLGLLLSSVKSVEQAVTRGNYRESKQPSWQIPTCEEILHESLQQVSSEDVVKTPLLEGKSQHEKSHEEEMLLAKALPAAMNDGLGQYFGPKTNLDPKNVEKGLAKLVLTLVDLIRKLMEKQAIRRMEAEQLNSEEIEKVGNTFFLLDKKIEQLKETFGLQDEDLNLDLGPLGELL
jgi:hypothetical protein